MQTSGAENRFQASLQRASAEKYRLCDSFRSHPINICINKEIYIYIYIYTYYLFFHVSILYFDRTYTCAHMCVVCTFIQWLYTYVWVAVQHVFKLHLSAYVYIYIYIYKLYEYMYTLNIFIKIV